MPVMTNPETGIRYDSETRQSIDRFTVTQNGDPTAFNKKWKALDGNPYVGGFPPGEEWWTVVNNDLPTYDFRYATVDTMQAVPCDPAAPVGHPSGTWEARRTATLKPVEELHAIIDAAKKQANNTIYPDGDDPSRRALVEDARAREAAGTMGDTEQDILTEHNERIAQMKLNEQHAKTLRAAATAGEPFDPTTGWVHGPRAAVDF
jgi:hypothetical protein